MKDDIKPFLSFLLVFRQSTYLSLFHSVTHQFLVMLTVFDISIHHNMRVVVGHGGGRGAVFGGRRCGTIL